jgi:hypothetical protein
MRVRERRAWYKPGEGSSLPAEPSLIACRYRLLLAKENPIVRSAQAIKIGAGLIALMQGAAAEIPARPKHERINVRTRVRLVRFTSAR